MQASKHSWRLFIDGLIVVIGLYIIASLSSLPDSQIIKSKSQPKPILNSTYPAQMYLD